MSIKIERYYKEKKNLKNLKKHTIRIIDKSDIVINGLGFIKINRESNIIIYANERVSIKIRKNLI